MIPLSMLLKRKDNTEAAVATDSADCACACDAAPKKQQTLEQHLKQYHHGQMPKGDCSWLKQYKKDHPDWQKDAAKVSKGEAAVDTVKKDEPKGKSKLIAKLKEGYRRGGEKKDYASEYLDAVEKDKSAKKSEKKDGKSSDVRLPNYPSKEDMKKNFDFDKAEKTIMDSVSSTGDITDIDSDILGDGCLTLSFGLKKGSKFGKAAKALLGDALEKMGIPRSAMEDPIPGTREDSAIVVVKLDSLIDKSLADNGGKGNNDPNTPEYIVDNESVEDIEALFSDNARKLIVANARKSAKKSGYDQFILWSPALGWGYTRDHGQKDSFKDFGQEIMGKVEIVNDGNIQYPEFHVNTDFDRMKPVKHYEAIQELLEAKKKELAK